jgi:HK97 family phage major capsid protein
MSTSNKTIREMRLEAESLLAEAKSLGAKGEEITPEDAVQINEKTDLAAKLIDTITQATASDGARKLADSEAALKALGVPDRPGFGNGGTGNFTQVQPGRSKDYRVEGFGRVSLGESLIHHDAYKSFNPGVQGSALGIEFPNLIDFYGNTKATFTTSGATVTQYDRQAGLVMLEQQRLTIADLLASGVTDMNTIRYVREDTYTNAATTVAEGGTKPEASFDTSEADAPVRKIAVTAKVSDELFADFPAMQAYIDNRLRYMVGSQEEAQILNGDGNAPNMTGILQTSGIQTQAVGSDTNLDAIHKALTKVRSVGFFEPDGIVLHPTDYQILRLAKDGNGQYLGGGAFMNQYGNGGYPGAFIPVWGVRVVVTTAISAGTALVGAFRLGAQLFRRAGVTVQMTNSNEDDFKKNLIAVRCEERAALAVYRPKAFATVTSIA